MTADSPQIITSKVLYEAFISAGIVRAGENIRRIIIDIRADDVVRLHIERFGDERLLEIVPILTDLEIRESRPRVRDNGR